MISIQHHLNIVNSLDVVQGCNLPFFKLGCISRISSMHVDERLLHCPCSGQYSFIGSDCFKHRNNEVFFVCCLEFFSITTAQLIVTSTIIRFFMTPVHHVKGYYARGVYIQSFNLCSCLSDHPHLLLLPLIMFLVSLLFGL